jgi:hypothetical protein
MSVERKRCVHCQSPYVYHPSFYGGEEVDYPYNHHDYCPDCRKVVVEALAGVPVRFEKRFLPAKDYTRDQIVTHQEERCATGFPMRRIMPGLYDMTGKTRHHIVCELMPDGEWYKAEWWSDDPGDAKVSRETWCENTVRGVTN